MNRFFTAARGLNGNHALVLAPAFWFRHTPFADGFFCVLPSVASLPACDFHSRVCVPRFNRPLTTTLRRVLPPHPSCAARDPDTRTARLWRSQCQHCGISHARSYGRRELPSKRWLLLTEMASSRPTSPFHPRNLRSSPSVLGPRASSGKV